MWIETPVFKEDLDAVCSLDYIPWEKLKYKTILVTGATGLIGASIINTLVYANLCKKLNLKVLALIRDEEKAKEIFQKQLTISTTLSLVIGDVENITDVNEKIDYIIHGASPTTSTYFIEKPVETIKTAVLGTINLLELAKKNNVAGFVYLSSMEIYGSPKTEDKLSEKDVGYINPLVIRNCYPEAKRQCEALCAAYAEEYKIPATSIRLAQTFGPGVGAKDVRVFAEFAKCAMEKKDIILLTDGSSKRCYLYTMDAVSAILTVLLKGKAGTAYNAANPRTYCSVFEMAQIVSNELAENLIKVKILNNKEESRKFPPSHFYNLDISAILKLGWKPTVNLIDMYKRMILTL